MQRNGLFRNRLIQICIITNEGDRMNANWAKLLGFDYTGLAIYDNPEKNVDTWYHGTVSKTAGIASNAVDLTGDGKWIQFEVLQAHGAPSEWNDFMQLRGSGIHHIAFEVDDPEKALETIESFSGKKAIQKGATFMDEGCFYGYLDTKQDMGTTIELLGFGEQLEHTHRYRELMIELDLQGDMPQKPLAGRVPCALTLIVKDVNAASAEYERFLDTKPVKKIEVKDNVKRNDTDTEQQYKKSIFDVESTTIELLEPGESDTVWKEFQKEWENGLFAMCFEIFDIKQSVSMLSEFNLKPVQYGSTEEYEYVVLDGTKDYGCMIELRTSEAIKRHLKIVESAREKRKKKYGAEIRYNESTALGHILEKTELFDRLVKENPGYEMIRMQQENKMIKRMPLGFVLRSLPGVTEDDVIHMLKILNE